MTSQLTVPELRDSLSSLSLSAHGNKVELQKRLRKAQRRIRQAEERMARAKREEGDGVWRPKYRRFLVLDVEATCEEAIFQGGPFVYPNEIIELPVVLLEWQDAPPAAEASNGSSASSSTSTSQLRLIDVFHTYVRPTARPQLSDFCKTLTGIQQEDIDRAPSFVQATVKLHDWMEAHDLLVLRGDGDGDDEDSSGSASSSTSSDDDRIALDPSHRIYTSRLAKDVLWATHGAYDLRDFLPKSAWISKLHYGPPRWMNGPLLDVRKAVGKYMQRQAALAVSAAATAAAATATGLCASSSSSSSDGEGEVRRASSAAASDAVASPATFRDGTIPALLSDLGLPPFEGRLHNGLDDTKNLARILIELSVRVGKEMAAAAAGAQGDASTRVASTATGLVAQPPSSPSRPSAPAPTPPPNTPPAGPRRWLAANKQRLLLHQRSASNSSISSSSSSSSLSSPVRAGPAATASAAATAATPDRAASPSPLPAASAYLEPNYTLPDLPPPPNCDDAAGEASKSGWRYYPKRFAWMGKKVGVVKWHVVERQAAEGEDWVVERRAEPQLGVGTGTGTGMAVGVGVGAGQGQGQQQQQRPQQPQQQQPQQQQRPPVGVGSAAMGPANGSVSGSGSVPGAAGGGGARKFQSARRRAGS